MKEIHFIISEAVDSYKISLFRMLFGLVLFFQSLYFYLNDFIENDVLNPVLHFPYPLLPFIKVLDPALMHSLLFLMFLSSILLVIGFKARLASLIYLLSFSYLWLLDKGYYNNHYYLISLLLFLFCFINSAQHLSITKSNGKRNSAWELYILQFQIALVFIYAGFNKLNYWWLIKHEPVHHILLGKASLNSNELWNSIVLEYLMVWGGMLFDIFIIPLLLWKRTQKAAIIVFFIFNGLNTWIFYDIGEIGIFPLLMISSLVLFIDEERVSYLLRKVKYTFKAKRSKKAKLEASNLIRKRVFYSLLLYICLQLVIPLRHHLYKGNVDYTGEGQRFSWRMKSVYKDFSIAILLKDEARDISARLDPRSVLTVKQYTNLGYYPELILPVVSNLRATAIEKGVVEPKIFVDYQVGFMGLKMQAMIDPEREAGSLKYSIFKHSDWILPLEKD